MVNAQVETVIENTFKSASMGGDLETASAIAIASLKVGGDVSTSELVAVLNRRKTGGNAHWYDRLISLIKTADDGGLGKAKVTAGEWYQNNTGGSIKEAIGSSVRRTAQDCGTLEDLVIKLGGQIRSLRSTGATEYASQLEEFIREVNATAPASDSIATGLAEKGSHWYSRYSDEREAVGRIVLGLSVATRNDRQLHSVLSKIAADLHHTGTHVLANSIDTFLRA